VWAGAQRRLQVCGRYVRCTLEEGVQWWIGVPMPLGDLLRVSAWVVGAALTDRLVRRQRAR
jgi:hypothetical protein